MQGIYNFTQLGPGRVWIFFPLDLKAAELHGEVIPNTSAAAAKAASRKGWDDDEDDGEGLGDTDDLDATKRDPLLSISQDSNPS